MEEAHALIEQLQWRVGQLEKQIYGPTSDRAPSTEETLSKEQILMALFPPAAAPPAASDVAVEEDWAQTEKVPRRRQMRTPAVLELETVTERLEPAEKVCPHCGKDKCEIGCEKSERFEYIPAKVIRHEIVRPKLACPCGQGTVAIAPLPPTPVEKGYPGPGLIAQVMLAKYDDHLPLYRQEQQFARLGVNFPRQMLCDWVEHGATWLQPVVRQMKAELLAGDYLQVDETPVKVMDPEVKGKCATGYLWLAGRPGGDVIFEFHPGRGKEYAQQLLSDFTGYLQRDGYGVYGSMAKDDPTRFKPCGCMAHARRKLIEALDHQPTQAEWLVVEMRKLYFIEGRARQEAMTAEQRHALRQQLATPILAEMKTRLEEIRPTVLPQSPLGKAVRYALAEWEPLNRYLEDGRLEIDNNLTENALRPSCVGKKNYLFFGHPDAGWRSAVIYSVIVSCRRRGIDPWTYLR
ncbi:MAG: IS66 family transposase, partial [Gemmatimonadota bacterium]